MIQESEQKSLVHVIRRSVGAVSIAMGCLSLAVTPSLLAQDASPESTIEGDAAQRRPAQLFSHRASVSNDQMGLCRLVLPPEVLERVRPDLADLRLEDGAGREIPFFVDGRSADDLEGIEETVPVRLLGVSRAESRRPLEGEALRTSLVETFQLAPPPRTTQVEGEPGSRWTLVVSTPRRELLRSAKVTYRMQDGSERTFPQSFSLFRLRQPPQENLHIELPAAKSPASLAAVVLELSGDDSNPSQAAFTYRRNRGLTTSEPAKVPLGLVSLPPAVPLAESASAGSTTLTFARPRGLVPNRVHLHSSTPTFRRQVVVWDDGAGRSASPLGTATIFRVAADPPIERLEIPLNRRPSGNQLRIVIQDDQGPPLSDLGLEAEITQPALVFALPASVLTDTFGPPSLFFGGGRNVRARDDLESFVRQNTAAGGPEAKALVELLRDPTRLCPMQLGPIDANPSFDPTPAFSFAHVAGGEFDPSFHRWRQPFTAKPSGDGVVRLRLKAEELAKAKANLADIRVVDAQSRQRPFVLDANSAELRFPVRVLLEAASGSGASEAGVSRYGLSTEIPGIAPERLWLDVSTPYFDRPFRLLSSEGLVVAKGRLSRNLSDPRPVLLATPNVKSFEGLELRIENGDDAPLDIVGVEASLQTSDLYMPIPAGDYELLLGADELAAPHYDLESLRSMLISTPASIVGDRGPLVANQDLSISARIDRRILLSGAVFLAVAVLLLLVFRSISGDAESTSDTNS